MMDSCETLSGYVSGGTEENEESPSEVGAVTVLANLSKKRTGWLTVLANLYVSSTASVV
jgi:hypothetical protein